MKKKSRSLDVWDEAVEKVNKNRKPKRSVTKDMVNRRLRPEPEIIEHILEDLEEKIKHYFNLFQSEKEKRAAADKNNYYLQEEISKAYETLEKNKIHTMKLEEKLSNIKDNQSSLIDTVRRIDLLYVQLDTLVQSFAGVCTHTATDVVDGNADLKKKKQTIQMLLDYIYPCRTLDPRINTLYGLLYYQTIGLVKGDFSGPPAPPIPPVVPSEINGWLPPSPSLFQKDYLGESEDFPSNKGFLSDSDFQKNTSISMGSSNRSMHGYPPGTNINIYSSGNGFETPELLGFDINIGMVEIKCNTENPKIVCVVRYDHETAYASIQNSKRITKPQTPATIIDTNDFCFKVNSTINLNSLPPKQQGIIPKFKIDIHDVKGKVLIGTAKCSFINEKTLKPNTSWDIYSRMNKTKPTVIGKIYVTIFPYPSNAKLPAEIFQQMKNRHSQYYPDSINSVDQLSSSQIDGGSSSIYSNININSSNYPVKSIMKTSGADNHNFISATSSTSPYKNSYQKTVSFKDSKAQEEIEKKFSGTPLKSTPVKSTPVKLSSMNSSLNKQKVKVTFKPYSSKKVVETTKVKIGDVLSPKSTFNKSNFELMNKWKNESKKDSSSSTEKTLTDKITKINETKNINETTKPVDILKKPINSSETESKGNKISNVNMIINKMKEMNNKNMKTQPMNFSKGNIKQASFVQKEITLEEKGNIKNSANEKENNSKVKNELSLILKKGIPSKPVVDKPDSEKSNSKEGSLSNKSANDASTNKTHTKIETPSATKNGIPAKETTANNNSQNNNTTSNESTTDKKLITSSGKTTPNIKSMVKEKRLVSKTLNQTKDINKTEKPITSKSGETTNSKELKPSLKLGSKSDSNSGVKNSQKNMTSDDVENNKTEIKKEVELNKKSAKNESSEATTTTTTKIKMPGKISKPIIKPKEPTKESESESVKVNVSNTNKNEINKQNNVKEVEIKRPVSLIKHKIVHTPLKTTDLKKNDTSLDHLSKSNKSLQNSLNKNTNENISPKTSKDEESTVLQKNKAGLIKHKVTTPSEFEARKHPPPPANPKLEHVDSDDPNLKKILEETKKKSLIINKNKMKQIVFKNHEKKRMIKKFIPKYKQEPQ